MAAMKPHGAFSPRYTMSLAEDGAFLITDRKAVHKRTARYYPAQFVSGCMSYDERTARFPDYVHAELWRLHDVRSRAQLARATRAAQARIESLFDELRKLQTTNVSEGLHVTLDGRTVRHDVALIEHVTL